jgi:hypothetical protein
MYGEHYGNDTGFGPSPPLLYPKIVVYTSPDMETWTFRGFALSDWPTKPYGTFFTPFAVYNKATGLIVMWFNAYLGGCCNGNWGVASSADGVHFTVLSLNQTGKYEHVDGNALWVDDDGSAYNIFSSLDEVISLFLSLLSPDTHSHSLHLSLRSLSLSLVCYLAFSSRFPPSSESP